MELPQQPALQPNERVASYRDPQLRVLFAVTLMAVLGVASIGPALPRLRDEFGVPVERIGLVVTMFTLPGVFLTPLLGIAADRFGRKPVLLPSLVLFGIAGAACSLAQSLTPLLVLRLLQGVGAAALASINLTLIGDLFQGRQRTAAMGYNASVLSVGTATYPLVGGGLAMIGWHWPFALPVLALPVAVLVATRLREPSIVQAQRLAAYLGGVWREIRKPSVLVLYASSCGIFILLYGAYLTFLPLFMADSFGSTPLVIGVIMTLQSAVNAITSSQLGRLSARIPEPRLLQIGLITFAAGLATIPFAPAAMALAIPAVVLGLAFATTIPVVMSLLAELAPDDQRAAFMSLNGTVLRLGQTLGPVIMAGLYAAGGFPAVYMAGAAFAVALAALTAAVLRS
jgi:MFS family permease